MRTYLDYGYIVYDQAFNTVLVIRSAIRGTSREKNYQEIGWSPSHKDAVVKKFQDTQKLISKKPFRYNPII